MPTLPDHATTQHHRQQFPALGNKAYFNYGGQGPMAEPALVAMRQTHDKIQREGPFSNQINGWLQAEGRLTRQAIAAEVGAPEAAITLTEDVTVGCNIPLWGIDWQAGDHILLTDCEHPGVIAAVQELSRRYQLEVSICRLLPELNQGNPVELIAAALRPQTRLVVVSHILWNTGQVFPLAEIVQLCHSHRPRPVWVLVDAAQSVGVLPLNLTALQADFYAFTGHKWWGGPAGLGGLYIRPEILAEIHPTFIGWRGIQVDEAAQPTGWQPDGRRFEIATSDYALYGGLRTAIALQNQWGTAEQRYQRICQLSANLWQRLQKIPQITCLCTSTPAAGLVSFQIRANGQHSPELHNQLVKTLEDQGIFVRTLLFPHCVRACVHYLTLEAEVDRLVSAIEQFVAQAAPHSPGSLHKAPAD